MVQFSTPIVADKARNLRFNTRAVVRLEEEFKMSAIKYFSNFAKNATELPFTDLIKLFHLSLVHEDKELTFDDCFDIWDMAVINEGFEGVSEKLVKALGDYFGLEKQEAKQAMANNSKKKK